MYGIPGAPEFYIIESARPGSPLANMPLAKALQLSSLAEQSGRGPLLIDYVARYGKDPAMMKALLEQSPDAIKAIRYIYDEATGQYIDILDGKFVPPRNVPWPSNNGFVTDPVDVTLAKDTIIDRYGKLTGDYAGLPGTSISNRGMAIGTENMPYTQLKVIKPLTVPGGTAAPVPAFGAVGGGTQYYFPNGIQWWIDNGYLEVIP